MVSNNPSEAQYKGLLRILAYLKRYPNIPLIYKGEQSNTTKFSLCGFSDSDHAGDASLRSRSASVITFGNCTVSWKSKLQTLTAGSSGQAETIAMVDTAKQMRALANVLQEFNILVLHSPLFVDSENAIAWCQGGTTKFTRHYEIRMNMLREYCNHGLIVPFKVHTSQNIADVLTKAKVSGGHDIFKRLRNLIFEGGQQAWIEDLLKGGFKATSRYKKFGDWKGKLQNVRPEELDEAPEVFDSERNIAYTISSQYSWNKLEPLVIVNPDKDGSNNDVLV
jgi:hypothetical protein